jgi:hypothetical protein
LGSIADLEGISSDVKGLVGSLAAASRNYADVSLAFLRTQCLDQALRAYPYFEPDPYIEKLRKWLDEEMSVLDDLDRHEGVTDIALLLEHTDRLRTGLASEMRTLEEKKSAKTNTVANFPNRHPLKVIKPSPDLPRARALLTSAQRRADVACAELSQNVHRAMEAVRTLSGPLVGFCGLHRFLSGQPDFPVRLMGEAGFQWETAIADGLHAQIEAKRRELAEIEAEKQRVIGMTKGASCGHRQVCSLGTCGHLLCDECARKCLHENGMKCILCQMPFTPNDVTIIRCKPI